VNPKAERASYSSVDGFVRIAVNRMVEYGLTSALVIGFEVGRRDVVKRLHRPMEAEPGHSFQRCEFHRLLDLPRPTPANDLGLVAPS